MIVQQRTIKEAISISGVGLHTGKECTMTFRPAAENHGIKFRRVDLHGSPEIPALVDYVTDVSRGTTISIGEVKVNTTEHVLAAVAGLEIDNILIDLDSSEPPICDGSAKYFVDALLKVGFQFQDSPRDYLVIEETIHYKNEEKGVDIVALPTDGYRLTVMVDYNNPALGSQHTGLFDMEKHFVEHFSMCRTFCFLNEVETLHEQGLIRGGNVNNAIVIVDKEYSPTELKKLENKLGLNDTLFLGKNGVLNEKDLYFKNEPARHKLLDLIGDLALIGVPIKAQILAARPGHANNVEFAKIIRKLYLQKKIISKYQHEKKAGVVFDVNAIKRILPHRHPFLLIDKVISFDLNKKIVAVKNVTGNEDFFQGHFPGTPVMPGVLIIEAMAQAGGILLLDGTTDQENNLVYFMAINNAKFRKMVVPGDQLILEVNLVLRKQKVCQIVGKAFVGNELVAEADMLANVSPRPKDRVQ